MGMTVVKEQHDVVEGDLPHERGMIFEFDDRYWAVAVISSNELQVVGSGANREGAKFRLQEHWADEQRRDLWERR